VWISQGTDFSVFELDELFWFIGERKGCEKGINAYIMTMISRLPRQIIGFAVDKNRRAEQIQPIVDGVKSAKIYFTDGNPAYKDVIFGGKHIWNATDKSDTHNVESVNADLRGYIPGLARRSRCFYRSAETLRSVLAVFVDAYNKYGEAKLKYRVPVKHKSLTPSKHLHKYRDLPFSFLDFL
jgi:IS1 family transposase